MRSGFFNKLSKLILRDDSTEKKSNYIEENKKLPVENEEPIDLSLDPSFVALANHRDENIRIYSEVPIKQIMNYLNEFNESDKQKNADIILKELEGLMKEWPAYKEDDSVIRDVRDYVKEYGSYDVVKYVDSIHPFLISPDKAKLLPELFEDFKNAFQRFSLDEHKNESKSPKP